MENKPYNPKLEMGITFLVGEIQEHSGKRKIGSVDLPKLRKSIAKIISDSVAITKGHKRGRWASIHKTTAHYSASRYHDTDITFRVHVNRAYRTLLMLGYLAEVKKGVNAEGAKFLTRYEATTKSIDLFTDNERIELKHLSHKKINHELIRNLRTTYVLPKFFF